MSVAGHAGRLVRLDARRAAEAVRRPRAGAWVAALLPAALAVGGLWSAGEAARAEVADGQGRLLLGALVAAAPALQAYPLLFRPADDGFLRRLGVPPGASFAVRALRLLLVTLGAALLLLVPSVATGRGIGAAAAVLAGAGLAGWAVSLATHARAAHRLALPKPDPGIGALFLGVDPELAAAAPLVYAPILPVVAAAVAGRWTGDPAGDAALRLLAVAAVSLLLLVPAARSFARALPRFAPRAVEMSWSPPPRPGETALVLDRGIFAWLPRRARAARARDVAVVERRFRWAGRVGALVAVAAVLALLRAGDEPAVRGWVAAAGLLVLVAQGAALVGLGRTERSGPRWIDRAAGVAPADRLIGRWAAGFGLSLALTVPVAIVWALRAPDSGGWLWLPAGAATALLAAAVSLAAAGR